MRCICPIAAEDDLRPTAADWDEDTAPVEEDAVGSTNALMVSIP